MALLEAIAALCFTMSIALFAAALAAAVELAHLRAILRTKAWDRYVPERPTPWRFP